jgi:hypothetical protein
MVTDELSADLHSPERELIELRMRHAELDAQIDELGENAPVDELHLRRLKKDRLALKDAIAQLERRLSPPDLA